MPRSSRIPEARIQRLQHFGVKIVQLQKDTKSISLNNSRFRIPAGKYFFITSEIESGRIFYARANRSISFYRKIRTPNNGAEFESLGTVQIGEQGDHLSANLSDLIEIFGVREKQAGISEATGQAAKKMFGMTVTFSVNPNNLHYKDLKEGRIYYQLWPSGKAVFFRKLGSERAYIGEVTRQQMLADCQKRGRSYVYLPDLIPDFAVFEYPITKNYEVSGESPAYGFYDSGIRYSISATDEMIYAPDIRAGNFYYREYTDRIAIGVKREGIFEALGEFTFDNQGQLLVDEHVFMHRGEPIIRNSGRTYYPGLKALIPELASVEKPFRYISTTRKDGKQSAECRADAHNHFFLLTSDPRNPFTQKVKDGRVTLRVHAKKAIILVDGNVAGRIAKDPQGNILNPDKTIAVPAGKARVLLTPLIPEIDIEESNFTYVAIKGGNRKDHVQMRFSGLRFLALVNKDWFIARWIREGSVYWRRKGNIISIRKKGQEIALGSFEIDKANRILISENGEEFPFPKNKNVNLAALTGAFNIEGKGLLHFIEKHDHEKTEDFVYRTDIRMIDSLVREMDTGGIALKDEVYLSCYYLALNTFMSRLARNEDKLEPQERLNMFFNALNAFFDAAGNPGRANGSGSVLEVHLRDIGGYLVELVERFGKRPVLRALHESSGGSLKPRLIALIESFEDF